MEEPTVDLFMVETPLQLEKLLRVDALSGINLMLEGANCLPGTRTLIVNIIRATRGDVSYSQVMLLDPQSQPGSRAQRMFCSPKPQMRSSLC